jgi:hypothetical protein
MANDAQARLAEMRQTRIQGLESQTRRQTALELLDETGQVTTETLDERMRTVWTPPDEGTLDNLMAQKAQASVAHEQRQVEKARDAQDRCARRTEKLRDRVQDAEEAEQRAADEVAAAERRLAEARELAEAAGGDPDAVPPGETVRVAPAAASASANGG